MRDHFKGVVWPHGSKAQGKGKPPVYRYVVVGILVTDTPIPSLEGPNTHGLSEFILDDQLQGEFAALLERAAKRAPKIRLGDASEVLVSLGDA